MFTITDFPVHDSDPGVHDADLAVHDPDPGDHDGPKHAHVATWGSTGGGDGQFRIPHGIAADAFGRVLVADDGNARVQVFTRDGVYMDQWGPLGDR